ncbi:MAG: hypothetical protein Q7J44_00660 [Pseudotabrizicola sp.]|uniref:hypothetical protein n=1 Tax=Pseudotabrizicola sp. TaxID=2939647 RepID=UPI002722243B|nr:hypothetical protein [Pseudotabrizicola sp.]MDO9637033.1 hypothetical protein [Pseudotabrizicola sp.]
MTIEKTAPLIPDPNDLGGVEPPVAPLAMPKQTLTREAGPLLRGFGAVLSLLRRDLGRVG